MNHIYRTKLTTAGLLSIAFSASILVTGCSTSTKNSVPNKPAALLSAPPLALLADAAKTDNASKDSIEAWVTIAKSHYESKRYARALIAANEVLSMDDQVVAARQIAMLSAVKVMQDNIGAYHNDALMSTNDKAAFKKTLTNMTTLVNTDP